jgi:hypothetical protein
MARGRNDTTQLMCGIPRREQGIPPGAAQDHHLWSVCLHWTELALLSTLDSRLPRSSLIGHNQPVGARGKIALKKPSVSS